MRERDVDAFDDRCGHCGTNLGHIRWLALLSLTVFGNDTQSATGPSIVSAKRASLCSVLCFVL